jgi:superfamily I DNA/RNA helicase
MPGVIGELLAQGVQPHEIAYVSFTRKAAQEAAGRAATRFGFDPQDLPHFRTIHSMAFRATGMAQQNVMQRADYREIAALLGVTFTGYTDPADGPAMPSREGDLILQWLAYAHARQLPLRQVWKESGEAVEWPLVKLFAETVATYKQDTGKHDFADMLDRFIQEGHEVPVKVAVIDEAQDLSTAQWTGVRSAFRNVPTIYLGGDDDQAVHAWAGADVGQLFRLQAKRTVLPTSHRLPREVFTLATGIARRIRQRFPKDWQAAEHSGHVQHLASPDTVDLSKGGTWMLLARNSCFLKDYERMCREQGVPYTTNAGPSVDPEHVRAIVTWERMRQGREVLLDDRQHAEGFARNGAPTEHVWHEALTRIDPARREYYQHCLRNGYRLQETAPVHVGTIHGVKGGEADNVVLKTDMTYRTRQALELDADNEHRVWYVGASRAKKNLLIIDNQEGEGYGI